MKIKKPILLYLLFFFLAFSGLKAQFYNEPEKIQNDSLPPPVIDLLPSSLTISFPDTVRFITEEVKVLNRGGAPLILSRIEGSCGCSTGTIVEGNVNPMSIGKIILNINLDGLYDDKNQVEYLIYSNAKNNPVSIKVYLDEESVKNYYKRKAENKK